MAPRQQGERGRGRGRRPPRNGDAAPAAPVPLAAVQEWFCAQVEQSWFVSPPSVAADREEIQVIGTLAEPHGDHPTDIDRETACAATIAEFRNMTRDARVEIAQVAELTWDRKVSWGVRCGARHELFTHASVPVMTRLRLEDRQVLDTLVAANVARSRSDALGWCVRQIADREAEWLDRLRGALAEVDRVRTEGSAVQGVPPEDAAPTDG